MKNLWCFEKYESRKIVEKYEWKFFGEWSMNERKKNVAFKKKYEGKNCLVEKKILMKNLSCFKKYKWKRKMFLKSMNEKICGVERYGKIVVVLKIW